MPSRRLSGAALVLLLAACGPAEGGEGGDGGFGGPSTPTVEVMLVEPQRLREVVTIPGQLEAELSVNLRVETEGVLASIEFAEGARVEEGDVLFRLRDDEERARLEEARARLALTEAVYRRTRRLVERDVSSQAELDRVKAERDVAAAEVEVARVARERTLLRAPFDGVMGALVVAPGDRVTDATELTRIDAIDRLQLLFTLPESALGVVRTGLPLEVRVAPYPGERFPGEIYFVSPTLDPQARRLLVKAWLPNADHRLRPGLFAEIDAEIQDRDDALLVPESALVYGLEGISVWRLDGDDRAHPAPVDLGVRQEGRVEVKRGLTPGDRVVVAGIHKVSAGLQVEPVTAEGEPAPSRDLAEDPAEPDAAAGRPGAPGRGAS